VKRGTSFAYGIAAAAGLILWFATSMLGGRREPWDSPVYWTVSYPVAIALAGALGYVFPEKPWRWALVIMFMQMVVMIVGGSGFGLLPLGLILLSVLSLPGAAVARWAAGIRVRRETPGSSASRSETSQ
jgi:hypothetical protein